MPHDDDNRFATLSANGKTIPNERSPDPGVLTIPPYCHGPECYGRDYPAFGFDGQPAKQDMATMSPSIVATSELMTKPPSRSLCTTSASSSPPNASRFTRSMLS